MTAWFVYLVECVDGSLYTGIATDVDRRYAEHVAGKGARYTRSHPPRTLLGRVAQADRSAALKAEHALRQLAPAGKRAWIAAHAKPLPAAESA
jgi:putative endonuclease